MEKFFEALEHNILAGINSESHSSHVIFLDKNHPPQALSSTIENINKFLNGYQGKKSFTLHKVAMVPAMAGSLF